MNAPAFKLRGDESLLRRRSDVCQQDAGVPLIVTFFFIAKFLGTFLAIIFAKNANQHTFCFGSFSGLARAARIAVNHIAASVAKNRVFNHLVLLYLKSIFLPVCFGLVSNFFSSVS